jgi:hypothetical protein
VVGGSHYTTFDNLHFDWQGTCAYELVSYCGYFKLPRFQIYSRNEHRYDDSAVSWPASVEIVLNTDTLRLGQISGVVTVNIVQVIIMFYVVRCICSLA